MSQNSAFDPIIKFATAVESFGVQPAGRTCENISNKYSVREAFDMYSKEMLDFTEKMSRKIEKNLQSPWNIVPLTVIQL